MKLSIITINYNNAAGLIKTIRSVVEQDFSDLEYIVIDGGSNDGSFEIIRNFSDNINYWISEPDKGIYDAMNKGVAAAKGEYLLFLNSGDFLIYPHIISKVFSSKVDSDILYGELIFDHGNGDEKLETLPDSISLQFLFNNNIWHPASFIRKSLFEKFGAYDSTFKIAGDYDFFFRVIIKEKCSTLFLPFPVSVYETTGASSVSGNFEKILQERDIVHRQYLDNKTIVYLTYKKLFKIGLLAHLMVWLPFMRKPANSIYSFLVSIRNEIRSVSSKSDITFFTPTFWRTGSEIVLWNLLNNFSGRKTVRLISRYKGDATLKLAPSVIKSYFYKKASVSFGSRINKVFRRIFIVPFFYLFNRHTPWYINTIALPDVLRKAEKLSVKVVLHVHELEQMFARLKRSEVDRILTYPSLIIANSQTTQKYLAGLGCKVPIKVIYPAFDTTKYRRNAEDYVAVRKQLGINTDDFVWVMCGTLDPNKNGILFLDTAAEVLKSKPYSTFLWLGATPDLNYRQTCLKHAESLGISGKVQWLYPESDNYIHYLNCADGFMLTSVRESFSMVTVEALLLGLPVVAQDCGGVTEILGKNTGVIVKELNTPLAMALPMIDYMNGQRTVDIIEARNKAESFDITVWAPVWNDVLTETLFN